MKTSWLTFWSFTTSRFVSQNPSRSYTSVSYVMILWHTPVCVKESWHHGRCNTEEAVLVSNLRERLEELRIHIQEWAADIYLTARRYYNSNVLLCTTTVVKGLIWENKISLFSKKVYNYIGTERKHFMSWTYGTCYFHFVWNFSTKYFQDGYLDNRTPFRERHSYSMFC